jgi:HSP20 family molecular chaperone IbpA
MSFSSPLLLGFEEIERLLERLTKAADGYPPYNIERIAASGNNPPRLRIILAVAGFGSADIEVTVDEKQLTIRGRHAGETPRDYLYRGIATREFRRVFVLADGLEVAGADLEDGLLTIELVRPESARAVKKIPITSRHANARRAT